MDIGNSNLNNIDLVIPKRLYIYMLAIALTVYRYFLNLFHKATVYAPKYVSLFFKEPIFNAKF